MVSSIVLAKILGFYLVIISIALLINLPMYRTNIKNMINDETSMILGGFIALIVGLLIVVGHNVWAYNWQVIITIVGWMALLKGVFILATPKLAKDINLKFLEIKLAYPVTLVITLLMGLFLLYHGFTHV
jgi:hypothetical protein